MAITWELDFYSRPIVDENNKKVWEILLCESQTGITPPSKPLFKYAEYCANNQVNSIWIAEAMQRAIAKAGESPDRIRFFRQSMNNMITKACGDINLIAMPSRRTFELSQWLQERMEKVYPEHPGYKAGSNASVVFPTTPPQRLPDALQGQKWQIVSLQAAAFDEFDEWDVDFGEAFSIKATGTANDALIPGLVIYSPRATAMAAWMSGLELAAVNLEQEGKQPCLVLETGVLDRWVLTPLPTPELKAEAERFEASKKAAGNIHFIALQTSPDVEEFAGFWMLRDVSLI
ncbi:Tab2/Atab2 family RNA-binding protein [filamentous cyanobacterium LEGE 11480]|uniref:Tab2/Atab2 family RNA-binding protein n=1 Tax=Romeriopsis navalis LEGE 11480 TaxID=2777977 RepID=A0A928VU92_9CYAN|nr:Tab2/Atab2 family RNA-binding protein [Romeriopsis navalis]MBE9032339.1 Tab2/Atab2 family RNA-binding protein [Romeriopsis navalis LEGE 11480]